MLAIVAVAFGVEAITHWVMKTAGLTAGGIAGILVDAAILAVLIAPPIYWLVLRPLEREHRRLLEAELRADSLGHLATTDPLTETLNRRGIIDRLDEAIAEASRYGRQLSVAMVDVDHFKRVNDRYGHAVGDRVLIRVAKVVTRGLRTPDKIGRLGGDEFLVILPETGLESSIALSERLRESFLHGLPDAELDIAVSIGTTEWSPDESHEQLLSRVDDALYQAKREGRNRVVSVTAPRAEKAETRKESATSLD
jgi:diguanylate cyclase (GGDEF)-like protein